MWYVFFFLTGAALGFLAAGILSGAKETPIPPDTLPLTDQDLETLESEINNKKEKANEGLEKLDPQGKVDLFNSFISNNRPKP